MKNKKNGMIIFIIIAMVIIVFAIYKINTNANFKITSGDITTKDEAEIDKIKYDIKITYHHEVEDTGYATTNNWDLINTYNKRAYLVTDYNVWGNEINPLKKGHNYTVKIVNLTDDDIQRIIDLSDKESDFTLIDDIYKEYVIIEKDGNKTYLNVSDFDFKYDNKK